MKRKILIPSSILHHEKQAFLDYQFAIDKRFHDFEEVETLSVSGDRLDQLEAQIIKMENHFQQVVVDLFSGQVDMASKEIMELLQRNFMIDALNKLNGLKNVVDRMKRRISDRINQADDLINKSNDIISNMPIRKRHTFIGDLNNPGGNWRADSNA